MAIFFFFDILYWNRKICCSSSYYFFFFRFSMLTDGSNWTMCWLKWSTTWTPSSCYFVHLTPYVFDFSDQFVKLCVEKKEERRERHAHTFREPWWTKQISVDIDYDYMSLYLLHSSNSLIFHFSSVRFWYGLKMVLILQWTLQTYPVFHAFICNLSCARNAITLGIFRVCTTFRPRNEIANADKKNNTVIIMFKASDANETNANNKTSAKRARDMHTTAAEWKERESEWEHFSYSYERVSHRITAFREYIVCWSYYHQF